MSYPFLTQTPSFCEISTCYSGHIFLSISIKIGVLIDPTILKPHVKFHYSNSIGSWFFCHLKIGILP